jgi:hypothetical protein
MRHFLLATTAPGALARRVFQRAAVTLLVSPRGAASGLAPTCLRAALRAVTVATIAAPADAHLLGASTAAIQPIALFADPHHPRLWHWTTPPIAGIKALQTCPHKRVTAEGPGFFQEFVRAFVYSAFGHENSANVSPTCAVPNDHTDNAAATTNPWVGRAAFQVRIPGKTFLPTQTPTHNIEGEMR